MHVSPFGLYLAPLFMGRVLAFAGYFLSARLSCIGNTHDVSDLRKSGDTGIPLARACFFVFFFLLVVTWLIAYCDESLPHTDHFNCIKK
jgi:hypothetical protein